MAVGPSETSVRTYQTTHHFVCSDDGNSRFLWNVGTYLRVLDYSSRYLSSPTHLRFWLLNIQVFWDMTPCQIIAIDLSEELPPCSDLRSLSFSFYFCIKSATACHWCKKAFLSYLTPFILLLIPCLGLIWVCTCIRGLHDTRDAPKWGLPGCNPPLKPKFKKHGFL
jgi:hypothetical protein